MEELKIKPHDDIEKEMFKTATKYITDEIKRIVVAAPNGLGRHDWDKINMFLDMLVETTDDRYVGLSLLNRVDCKR